MVVSVQLESYYGVCAWRAHTPGITTVSYGPLACAFDVCQPGHHKVKHRLALLRRVLVCPRAHPAPERGPCGSQLDAPCGRLLLCGRVAFYVTFSIDPHVLPLRPCV